MSDRVWITDVAPRDGLQGEPDPVPTERKAELVRACAHTGVAAVEVTSFVSPKWIPQLGDAAELLAMLDKPEGVHYLALVPNERGLDGLLAANDDAGSKLVDTAAVFTAASETFAQKNVNASVEETLMRFEPVVDRARAEGLWVRGYVSCAVACPYEGEVSPAAVAHVSAALAELGVDEIDLGDTIGAADPAAIESLLPDVIDRLSSLLSKPGVRPRLTLHLHDTNGRAGDCVRTAIDLGVRSFDASAGGLGGCPYASTTGRRAPGNVSLRTVAQAVRDAGFDPGLDGDALAAAERIAGELVGGAP